MNTAQRIILSVFAPVLVGLPILTIDMKTNLQVSGSVSSWNPVPLYNSPLAWWVLALASTIFLMFLWGNKKGELTKQPDGQVSPEGAPSDCL